MVSKCGSEMSGHIPAIVDLCLEYITYDPNYNYDDEDDSDMDCDNAGEEDDVSCKVRRVAAKCLEAVIMTRPVTLLQSQVANIVKAIRKQIKEKTRQGCFALLTDLIQVLPGSLASHMDQIIPGIQFCLG